MSVADEDVPAVPADEAANRAAKQDWAEALVELARSECVELAGDRGPVGGVGAPRCCRPEGVPETHDKWSALFCPLVASA